MVVNSPTEHRRVVPIRFVAGGTVCGIAADQFIEKVRAGATAGESENRLHERRNFWWASPALFFLLLFLGGRKHFRFAAKIPQPDASVVRTDRQKRSIG